MTSFFWHPDKFQSPTDNELFKWHQLEPKYVNKFVAHHTLVLLSLRFYLSVWDLRIAAFVAHCFNSRCFSLTYLISDATQSLRLTQHSSGYLVLHFHPPSDIQTGKMFYQYLLFTLYTTFKVLWAVLDIMKNIVFSFSDLPKLILSRTFVI